MAEAESGNNGDEGEHIMAEDNNQSGLFELLQIMLLIHSCFALNQRQTKDLEAL